MKIKEIILLFLCVLNFLKAELNFALECSTLSDEGSI